MTTEQTIAENPKAVPLGQMDIDRILGTEGSGAADRRPVMEEIANSTIVNYERLPMLDVITDRLVRLLSDSLRQFMSTNVTIGTRSIESVRFGDFMSTVGVPSTIAVLKAEDWDGSCMAVLDQNLSFAIVDVLMGGQETIADFKECRPLTSIERRLMARIMTGFAADLSRAFEGLTAVTFALDRLETNPQLAQISRATNVAVRIQLAIDIDDRGGVMDLIIPYSTLEPVRPLLVQVFMGEKFGRDQLWQRHFHDALMQMEVDLSAVLHEARLSLAETLNWKKGTFLTLDLTSDSPTRLMVAGQELFAGKMGQKNGRIAIRIETDKLSESQGEKNAS